jgi:hypothetical protein
VHSPFLHAYEEPPPKSRRAPHQRLAARREPIQMIAQVLRCSVAPWSTNPRRPRPTSPPLRSCFLK